MKTKTEKPPAQVVPLRVPPDMGLRIRKLARNNHLSDADIMRMALDRGFPAVERMFAPQEKQAA
jgi:lambda repressor-like predicted transcriptional regulator